MKYDISVSIYVAKTTKRMIARMETHIFNPFNAISIIKFLKNYELFCDKNDVHEGAAMWLFTLIMDKTISSALHSFSSAEDTDKKYSRTASGELNSLTPIYR